MTTDAILVYAASAWGILTAMAPYLLLGFALAGVLFVWLSPAWVERHLGGRGWRSATRAAFFGVPLPLCSCSVIPVSASLRRHGASRGATAAFLMSTPQASIGSIFVTYGLLGPLMAIVRPIVAFVSGALCGTLIDTAGGREPEPLSAPAESPGRRTDGRPTPGWRRALRHAAVTLPSDLARPVLVGVAVAALLGALLPPDAFADRLRPGLGAMLIMMAVGVPIYVCSTSSVPVALALIHAGVPEGAALVFLITGPATNAAALTTLHRMVGGRSMLIYLGTLVVTALAAGALLDGWLLARRPDLSACHIEHTGAGPWSHAAAAALLVLLLVPLVRDLARRRPKA